VAKWYIEVMVDKKKKTTSEKPVSLEPLDFEEALRDLLTIPPSKEPKEQERKQSKRRNKKKSDSE